MIKQVVLTFSLLGFIIVGCSNKSKVVDNSRYVKVFAVGDSVDQSSSTFHGIVHAEFEPNLSFQVTGKIVKRFVDIGQAVKLGQVLAKLDPADYQLSADSAKAQLASAKSNYVTQKVNLERYRQLLTQNFVSEAQYDAEKAKFDSASAQFEEAKNQLSNMQNQVDYTTLAAPSDGVITSINMDAGQVVSSGQTVATMAASGKKEVLVELPEDQINNYKVDMPAKIKIWATGQNYIGKIRTINQASDQQTRTFTARIVIFNPDLNIKYGMAADVFIIPLNSSSGLELPLSSLFALNGKSFVWVLDTHSLAKLVPVEVLSTDGASMKVKSTQVHNGDRVVSAGVSFIHEGQLLKVYAN